MSEKRNSIVFRAQVVRAIRAFFEQRGYIEVQTPILTRSPAPEPYIDCFLVDGGHYLIPSPELNMKRLMAQAGLERCYQLGPVFRKGERGRLHNQEFTMLEWYSLGSNYVDLMHEVEALVSHILEELSLSSTICYQGATVEMAPPYIRMTVEEAFIRFAGASPSWVAYEDDSFDKAMVEQIEPGLASLERPVFLYDWPKERASLARLKAEDPRVAERVEFYAGGLELANGFSELTDPEEQAARFHWANKVRKRLGKETWPWPGDFLDALGDLGPCAGMALGLERLLMLLSDKASIDDVMAFAIEDA